MKVHAVVTREFSILLSEREASFLLALLTCVGGPETGPRKIADDLHDALSALELDYTTFIERTEGSVYFQ